ncbi:transglutaminase [Rhodobacterales bacterium 59_46_T64]|nr:transglutaminase [Rhodobacterales bacterium 59_46_T64]
MRLKISHTTTYCYDVPVHYALQQLRLTPRSDHGQTIETWNAVITGGTKEVSFDDHFGNHVDLVLMDDGADKIEITCEGVVSTVDNAGIIGQHRGYAPLWLYREPTAVTAPDAALRKLARSYSKAGQTGGDWLPELHSLSAEILNHVSYETGQTIATTTADEAWAAGHGVCQDHAHIMITTARLMGLPARYVSGYLLMEGVEQQDATHAWCEVHVDGIGWVGFDVSNGISPDERYVRVATGRDYAEAAPIHGLRLGAGTEDLQVRLQVQQ